MPLAASCTFLLRSSGRTAAGSSVKLPIPGRLRFLYLYRYWVSSNGNFKAWLLAQVKQYTATQILEINYRYGQLFGSKPVKNLTLNPQIEHAHPGRERFYGVLGKEPWPPAKVVATIAFGHPCRPFIHRSHVNQYFCPLGQKGRNRGQFTPKLQPLGYFICFFAYFGVYCSFFQEAWLG